MKTEKNLYSLYNLFGKVKSINEITYNEDGKLPGITKNLFLASKQFLLFDTATNLLEDILIGYDTKWYTKVTYMYNDLGKLLETKYFKQNGDLKRQYFYKYDDSGKKVEKSCFTPDGECLSIIKSVYDSNENLVEQNYYKPVGTLLKKEYFQYDNRGNVIQNKTYNVKKDILYRVETCEYDDSDREIKSSIRVRNSKLGGIITFKYDDRGNRIEGTFMKGHTLIPGTTFYNKFDENGNEVESTIIDFKGDKGTSYHKYKYDRFNNWIQSIQSKNSTILEIVERTIEYY